VIASQHFTDIKILFKPEAALSAYLGPWWVEYKRDGLKKVHAFATATEAATFGSKLEVGELDDDVLAGKRLAPTKIGATRGPYRINEKSMFGDSYVDIDGGVGDGLIHEWRSMASVAVKTEGMPSEQGKANARLFAASYSLRAALLAICDSTHEVVAEARATQPIMTASLATLESARHAALTLLDVLGVS
jgi:hypothetical protein